MANDLHAAYLLFVNHSTGEKRPYEFYDITKPISNPKVLLARMAANAYEDRNEFPYFTKEFKDVVMNRKSFYAVAVANAPVLDTTKPLKLTLIKGGQSFPGDHTFENLKHFRIQMIDGTEIQITYFENRLKKYGGGELQRGEWEDYKFELNTSGPTILSDDSGGSNMGGSVPPPGFLRIDSDESKRPVKAEEEALERS